MKLTYAPHLCKKSTTSGASRNLKVYSFNKTIHAKHKKLFKYSSWKSGRGKFGKIVTLSKGRRILTSRTSTLNRSYRDTSISFISGFTPNPYSRTLSTTIFSGSGSVTVVPSTESHKVLTLTFLKTVFHKKSSLYDSVLMLKRNLLIKNSFYIVMQLPRHCHVSNIEVMPTAGATLARSPGTSAKLIKIDPRTALSLVKLPSGVKKVISIFSTGCLGKSSMAEMNKLRITSASSSLRRGIAPRSRGVAKNPVDHPHGGRTKAIKYPRTPWGKTTKFK